MPKEEFTNVRVPNEIIGRIEQLLPLLGPRQSLTSFIEEAVSAIVEMAEAEPERRSVPSIIRRIDAAREQNPMILGTERRADKAASALLKKAKENL